MAFSARFEPLVLREPRGHAASVAARQPLGAALAAEGSGDDPSRLGPHGPKLLPRPIRPKNDGSSTSGSNNKRGGGGGGGGGRGPTGMGERTMASLAAYSGLVGTTALLLGNLVGFDLWGEFDWASLEDLRLAAIASVPLQLLNAVLLLPSYSSPQRLPDLGNLEAMAAKLRSEQQQRQAEETAAEAPTSPAAPASSSSSAEEASPASAGPDKLSSTSQPLPAAQGPPAPTAASPAAAPDRPAQPAAGAPGLVPADAWGRSGTGDAKAAPEERWTALRSALHLAQGYYISNNPTARLTPAAESAYTLIDAAAGEMLYRGVALTWLASWLEDRVYEAGVDEAVLYQLPAAAAALGLPEVGDVVAKLGVYGACECAVAAALASFVVVSVLSRSRRAAQRLEMLISVAAPSSSSSTRTGSRGAATGGGNAKAGGAASGAGNGARAAAQVLFGPGGPSVGATSAGVVMQRAAAIQATRDAFQILLLNSVFIASGGNLAASYTVSVINQLVISAMQRRGVRRMRERSAALARELRAYNAQMQRIAGKYKDKLPKAAAARLDALGEDEGAPTTASSSGSHGSAPAPVSPSAFTESTISSGSSSSSSSVSPVGGSSDSRGGEDGAAAARDSAGDSSTTNSSSIIHDSSSSMARALAMLDRLVPEPPKPAASNDKKRLPQGQAQPQQPQGSQQ